LRLSSVGGPDAAKSSSLLNRDSIPSTILAARTRTRTACVCARPSPCVPKSDLDAKPKTSTPSPKWQLGPSVFPERGLFAREKIESVTDSLNRTNDALRHATPHLESPMDHRPITQTTIHLILPPRSRGRALPRLRGTQIPTRFARSVGIGAEGERLVREERFAQARPSRRRRREGQQANRPDGGEAISKPRLGAAMRAPAPGSTGGGGP